ncbi:MAG: hypothetical protein WBY53_13745 [Acidobacteriaceae bacterium]
MPHPFRTLALAALVAILPTTISHAQRPKPIKPSPSAQDSAHDFTILTHRMDVDVDGAPNAYGPPGSHTLDKLRNARYRGRPFGEIVGYLTDDDHPNIPILQGPHDPYPGDYISQTAFTDPAITNPANPRRYVDATRINYVVLGKRARKRGARLGDFVTVTSLRTHRTVFAIVGDDGNPSGNEGSLHLLQSLGYPFTNGIDDAVTHPEIQIHFYPHSNPHNFFPQTQAALNAAAQAAGLTRIQPASTASNR